MPTERTSLKLTRRTEPQAEEGRLLDAPEVDPTMCDRGRVGCLGVVSGTTERQADPRQPQSTKKARVPEQEGQDTPGG